MVVSDEQYKEVMDELKTCAGQFLSMMDGDLDYIKHPSMYKDDILAVIHKYEPDFDLEKFWREDDYENDDDSWDLEDLTEYNRNENVDQAESGGP